MRQMLMAFHLLPPPPALLCHCLSWLRNRALLVGSNLLTPRTRARRQQARSIVRREGARREEAAAEEEEEEEANMIKFATRFNAEQARK